MNIIVTGGHSGIGYELTKLLLLDGHKVGLVVRNNKRKEDAIKEFSSNEKLDFFIGDLSKRSEINQISESIKNRWDSIDGIFNNAGVLLDKLYMSDNNNELQFEINTLTPYILTNSLKPLLDRAEQPFVVNTATGGLNTKKTLDISELQKPKKFVKLMGSYMNSKFAMVLLMNYLADEWKNVRIISVNPGAIKTKMTKGDAMPPWLVPIRNLFFSKPEAGARKLYLAAFDQRFSQVSGVLISENKIREMNYRLDKAEFMEIIRTIPVAQNS